MEAEKPKRKKTTSPTQRSLKQLRKDGWVCQVVERWCAFSRRRVDLYGGIDVLCIREGETLGVQACAGASTAARLTKLLAEPKLRTWVAAGNRLEVWGWRIVKRGLPKPTWLADVRVIQLADFADVPEAGAA